MYNALVLKKERLMQCIRHEILFGMGPKLSENGIMRREIRDQIKSIFEYTAKS